MTNKQYAFIIFFGPLLTGILIMLQGCNITIPQLPDVVIKPPVSTPTTTTIPPAPVQPDAPIVTEYGKRIEPPAKLAGGECPVPGGCDIRFDVYSPSKGDYVFYGDLLAKHCVINRKPDNRYSVYLPDVVVDGVVFKAESWNFPSSVSPKHPGNLCESYDRSGTFRFWINCYEVKR